METSPIQLPIDLDFDVARFAGPQQTQRIGEFSPCEFTLDKPGPLCEVAPAFEVRGIDVLELKSLRCTDPVCRAHRYAAFVAAR